MKKGVSKLMTLFIAVCVTLSGFAMSSCCVSEHVYSDFWTYDMQYHYRAAECKHGDEITDKEEHDGDICSVCGYVDESLVTKGVGVNSDGYVYADRPNWYEEDEKPDSIVIPSFLGGIRVIGISEGAFGRLAGSDYYSNVTRIVLPSGIERVKTRKITASNENGAPFSSTAYYNDSANWENGLLYIGGCLIAARPSELQSLSVKEGTRVIADWLLGEYANDTVPSEITFPGSLVTIGDGAFYPCKVQNLTVPKHVKYIGDKAFMCADLKEVIFENPKGWSTWIDDMSQAPTYLYGFWVYPKKKMTFPEKVLSDPEKAALRLDDTSGGWVRE